MDNFFYLHLVELICICVFALSAVLMDASRGKDIVSIVVIAMITALGGGTLRDMMLFSQSQLFWVREPNYFWVAFFSAVISFFIVPFIRHRHTDRIIIILDTFGVALFSVSVTKRLLVEGQGAYVAISMGMITAVFGGVLRDIIIQRPTLFNNTDFYATPIILGCALYSALYHFEFYSLWSSVFSMAFIILFRLYVVYKGHQFPSSLLLK